MEHEVWRPVVGWEMYQVSSLGRIRSRHQSQRAKPLAGCPGWRLIRGGRSQGGYRRLVMYRTGAGGSVERRHATFATLVAEAFLGPRPEGMVICHNDGDKVNNAAGNLRYASQADNIRDKWKHGTMPVGERAAGAKLTEEQVLSIRESDTPIADLASKFGVKRDTIIRVRTGRGWKHVGGRTRSGYAKGARHSMAKLSEEDVHAIRRRCGEGEHAKRVAMDYGVSAGTVYSILSGRSWAHLARR